MTVDIIIMRKNGSFILIKRANPPFEGYWAIPGGMVEYGERVEDAVVREAMEETGLKVKPIALVGVYSDPNRDPRGHVVSIAFLAHEVSGEMKASGDAKDVGAFKMAPKKLAFDHVKILKDALRLYGTLYKASG